MTAVSHPLRESNLFRLSPPRQVKYNQPGPPSERAVSRNLTTASLTFHYAQYGSVISVLEPFLGQGGWLELSKLTITSLDTEEFLILTAITDAGAVLDADRCRKLLSLPASINPGFNDTSSASPPDFSAQRDAELAIRVREVERRNMQHFDEEVLKLDHWSDDLKQGLEREIKDLDKQIREARTVAASLNEKLEAQKLIRTLEATRKDKRKRLFDAQDEIDTRRDELIARIEVQLSQQKSILPLFTIHWSLSTSGHA